MLGFTARGPSLHGPRGKSADHSRSEPPCFDPQATHRHKSSRRSQVLDQSRAHEKNDEIVTKNVVKQHKKMLVGIFTELPRAPPSALSIQNALMDAIGCSKQEHESLQRAKVAWCKDEKQKLHMVWRYVRDSISRSPTSRDRALDDIKNCFRNVPGFDTEDGADGSRAAEGSQEDDTQQSYVEALGQAMGLESPESGADVEEGAEVEEPRAEVAPASGCSQAVLLHASPKRRLSRKSSASTEPPSRRLSRKDSASAEPPSRSRRLSKRVSCVSVASSDPADQDLTPGRKGSRVPESPLGRKQIVSGFAVSPPAGGVQMTPTVRTRFWTPAMKKKKKALKKPASAMKKTKKKLEKTKKKKSKDPPSSPSSPSKAIKAPPMKEQQAPPSKKTSLGANSPIWLEELKDFASSPENRKWGEETSKTIAKALKVKPEMGPCFDRCTVTKMHQREHSFIAQFKRDKRVLGQITMGTFQHKFSFVANLLHYVAGVGYSDADWKRFKEIMQLENATAKRWAD